LFIVFQVTFMCGILGIIKNNQIIEKDAFAQLNDVQVHRGPDAGGVWFSQDLSVALGHRRLSIIDLDLGSQPMLSGDGGLIITFNGEIYNYQELKSELIRRDHNFKTNSDTEVILNSYKEWGGECVKKFRGMFAFAIVDQNKKELFLARDQFGIKPLVYYHSEDIFCFASEIRTLAKIKNLDLALNYSSIDYYLWLQYIPDPITIYKNIWKLEAAHSMRIDLYGKIIEKKRYWFPEFNPRYDKTEEEWIEGFEEVICDSVKMHTVSDVPVGAFLSGGIDSTIISQNLSIVSSNFKTFSIGFEEEEYNELMYSQEVSKKIGSGHYQKVIIPDFFPVMGKLVEYYGEPFGDSSAIAAYFVSKLASEKVKVVLSGDGGDELFGGYNSYVAWQDRMDKKSKRSMLLNIARSLMGKIRPYKYVPEKPTLECWMNLVEYFNYYNRRYLWKKEYHQQLNKKYVFFDNYKDSFTKNSLVHKAQLFDLTNYLPFDILKKVDIASMINSLEVRVPFLDKKVAEYALTMPEEVNKKGEKWEGKKILKKILDKNFSSSFIYRKKQGFAIPLDTWFGSQGKLYSEPYMRLMNSGSEIFKQIFNLDAVYNFINLGDHSRTYFLLFLEEWLRQYENRKDLIRI
jgi:asparagine synthase (glutamine-hydrolysing)